MLEDARFALRTLVKRPRSSLLLVTTLALGLAANAVIFNVLDAVVLRAFSFPNQDRLVRLHETSRDFNGIDLSNVAPGNLIDWQAQSGGVLDQVVGMEWWDASLRGRESSERVQGLLGRGRASSTRWASLRPQGRGFLAEEAREGQEQEGRARPRALAARLRRRADAGARRSSSTPSRTSWSASRRPASSSPRDRGLGAARAARRRRTRRATSAT